jgi:hypothetical protein
MVRTGQTRLVRCHPPSFTSILAGPQVKAPVAQWTERLPSKQRVAGSSPAGGAATPQVKGHFARPRLTASDPDLPPNHASSRGCRVVVGASLNHPDRARPTGRDARSPRTVETGGLSSQPASRSHPSSCHGQPRDEVPHRGCQRRQLDAMCQWLQDERRPG